MVYWLFKALLAAGSSEQQERIGSMRLVYFPIYMNGSFFMANVHPERLTWNMYEHVLMEVWNMIFPFNWVIFRFQSLIFHGVGKYVVRPIDPSWVFDFLCWKFGRVSLVDVFSVGGEARSSTSGKKRGVWPLDHHVGWFPWIYLSHMLRMGLEYHTYMNGLNLW